MTAGNIIKSIKRLTTIIYQYALELAGPFIRMIVIARKKARVSLYLLATLLITSPLIVGKYHSIFGGPFVTMFILNTLALYFTIWIAWQVKFNEPNGTWPVIFNVAFVVFSAIVSLVGAGMIQYGWYLKTKPPVKDYINFDFVISDYNKSNPYIEIIKEEKTFIHTEGDDCQSYRIRAKPGERKLDQPFAPMSYTRTETEAKTEDIEKWNKLCDTIKGSKGPTPVSPIATDIDNKKAFTPAQNATAFLLRQGKELGVFVKGYADAQVVPWQKEINPDHPYKSIDFYQSLDSFGVIYDIKDSRISTHNVSANPNIKEGYYGNNDLPYLRAKFVYDKYFRDFLDICTDNELDSGILQGEVLGVTDPDKRGVDVYVTLCNPQKFPGCTSR